jgi:putative transcriptional regulator
MILRQSQDIAGLFRDGRARAGWSQAKLAARVGVSRQWISLVETGKTSVEFDLVIGALQALGYQLRVDAAGETPATTDADPLDVATHRSSGRTLLTRRGEPLGTQRTRRRSGSRKPTGGQGD